MKKYNAYKDTETDDTKSVCYFVEEDLKTSTEFKMDAPGRACLAVLRHLGRIKEHRGAGILRYIVQ